MDVDDDALRSLLASPSEPNEGRFVRDFDQVERIGAGNFSTVYKARNKLDGHQYAVKKTIRISRGAAQTQLNEIFALATMAAADAASLNIVRYFSSWMEDDRLHIQTELCECSLRKVMVRRKEAFAEQNMVSVLRDVANGLKALHERAYVHMDIKPDNILSQRGVYKIADFGLATAAIKGKCDDISEGDCRYLSREVMKGDLSQLPKADVFALGLVCYELLINPRELPANGDEWQAIRDGRLQLGQLECLPLLLSMVQPTPEARPHAADIIAHPRVSLVDEQLQQERLQRIEAEQAAKKSRAQANDYFQEMLLLKKQQLLREDAREQERQERRERPFSNGRPIASPSPRSELLRRATM